MIDWEQGACRALVRQLTPEVGAVEAQRRVYRMFYPSVPRGLTTRQCDPYAAARKVCADCPLAERCLEDAKASGDIRGVRAGYDPRQLAALAGYSLRRVPA